MDSGRAFAACALLCALLAAVAAIKIDSHISASTSDCYERVALGRRVAPEEVLRAVAVSSLKQCERECNLALDRCGAFSFGIGAKGNGSCELSAPAARRLPLREDPDWDTWRKRAECRVRPPPDYATATHDHPHGAPPDSGSSETPSYSHGDDHGSGHHSHTPGHDSYAPPQDSYRPPQDSYGTPEDSYGPPKDSYGPPKDSYGPPKDSYGPPKDSYGPPKDSYVPPKDSYGPPKDSYGPPQDSYGPPQDSYGPPQDPYGPTGHDFYSPSHDHSPGFPGNHYGPPHVSSCSHEASG